MAAYEATEIVPEFRFQLETFDDVSVEDNLLASFSSQDGVTRMTQAVCQQNIQAVELLARQAKDLNTTSRVFDQERRVWRWEAPLITAARSGFLEVVKILVAHGAALDITDQTTGKSPLHWACARGHFEISCFLVQSGANVNKMDFYMEPPIVEAIGTRHYLLAQFLINSGAHLETPVNYDRDTALLFALSIRELKTGRFLIQAGARVNIMSKESIDLMSAFISSFAHVEETDEHEETLLMLLAARCPVKVKHLSMARHWTGTRHFVPTLESHMIQPAPLTRQCRLSIRKVVQDHAPKPNITILPRLQKLPLPAWLIEYVKFAHV